MFRRFLRSQIYPITVTGTSRQPAGGITVDARLLDAAGILPHETILCSNLNNGEQFLVNARKGRPGRGEIILNGPSPRHGVRGDRLIISGFEHIDVRMLRRQERSVIHVDHRNRIVRRCSAG